MSLETKIHKAIEILRCRAEDDEFLLSYSCSPTYYNSVLKRMDNLDPKPWRAECCNDVRSVCLGEVSGVYVGNGMTPEEAVDNMILDMAEMKSKRHNLCDNKGAPVRL